MLRSLGIPSVLLFLLGLCALGLGLRQAVESRAQEPPPLVSVAALLCMVAAAWHAKAKGRSGWHGLLGMLNVLGLAYVILLPSRDRGAERGIRRPILARGATALAAVILGLAAQIVPMAGGGTQRAFAATAKGDLETVQRMIKNSPDVVNSRDRDGLTLLHWAAYKGRRNVADLLLANGADLDARGNSVETPLHLAASEGHADVAELLLARRANVNAKGKGDTTPLHLAAFYGHNAVAELLLANNAEVNAENDQGATPLRAAVRGHHPDTADLIRKHGGHE